MGRMEYLRMSTDDDNQKAADLIESDINELKVAAKRLIADATKLGGLGFGTSFLKWVASFSAIEFICLALMSAVYRVPNSCDMESTYEIQKILYFTMPFIVIETIGPLILQASSYLLILDRTNWRTNMLTALLVPYIFFSLPKVLFDFLRGDFGKWVAFIAVVLRLFFPRHFPDWLEMPGSLILLLVVSPNFLAVTLKNNWVGVFICLIIGCYLLQEHIRASGGFRNSFTQPHGISNTLGIILLIVYPVWSLLLHFL